MSIWTNQEEEDLRQLELDFREEGYDIIWFVQNFLDVRRERIKEELKKESEVGE